MGILVAVFIVAFVAFLLIALFSQGKKGRPGSGSSGRLYGGSTTHFTHNNREHYDDPNFHRDHYLDNQPGVNQDQNFNLEFGQGAPAEMIETGADFNRSVSDADSGWNDTSSSSSWSDSGSSWSDSGSSDSGSSDSGSSSSSD